MALITKNGEDTRVPGKALPKALRRDGALGKLDGMALNKFKRLPMLKQGGLLEDARNEKYARITSLIARVKDESYGNFQNRWDAVPLLLAEVPGKPRRVQKAILAALAPVLLIEGGKYRCLKAFYKVKGDILAGLHGIMENDPLPMNKRFAIVAIGKIADCASYPHILKTMKIHGMREDVYKSLVDVVPVIAFRYINAGPESTKLHEDAWGKAIKEAGTV
ncbi:MAG: hypothetical protein WC861_00890 [Candidatus Micrarchaeia archaeon]|jgi:hypothetical protein